MRLNSELTPSWSSPKSTQMTMRIILFFNWAISTNRGISPVGEVNKVKVNDREIWQHGPSPLWNKFAYTFGSAPLTRSERLERFRKCVKNDAFKGRGTSKAESGISLQVQGTDDKITKGRSKNLLERELHSNHS